MKQNVSEQFLKKKTVLFEKWLFLSFVHLKYPFKLVYQNNYRALEWYP